MTDMDSETVLFRQFEGSCIDYDIAIDEEDYKWKWKVGSKSKWPLEHMLPINEDPHSRRFYSFNFLEESLGEDFHTKLQLPEAKGWSKDLRRIILAKRARAVLQEANTTGTLDLLDDLALYLLKHLPDVPHQRSEVCCGHQRRELLLRLIYLSEIAACYRGFLSIGYADQCLTVIKNMIGEGKSPYELVALYNKAQGYLHARDHEKAFYEFVKVAKAKREEKSCYFAEESEPHWWQWTRGDKKLFDRYVIIPSILMIADTLINLQQTDEAKKWLKRLEPGSIEEWVFSNSESVLSEYHKARKQILEWRIDNDMKLLSRDFRKKLARTEKSLAITEESLAKSLEELKSRVDPKLEIQQKKLLESNRRSIVIERRFEACDCVLDVLELLLGEEENDRGNQDRGERPEEKSNTKGSLMTIATECLTKARSVIEGQIQEVQKNRNENDQALLLWTNGLKVCNRLGRIAKRLNSSDLLTKALETFREYVGLTVCGKKVRDMAKEAVTDDFKHSHEQEIREKLTGDVRSLIYTITEIGTQNDAVSKVGQEVLNELEEYAKNLFESLTKQLPEHKKLTSYEKNLYESWLGELQKDSGDGTDFRTLRELVATQFVDCRFYQHDGGWVRRCCRDYRCSSRCCQFSQRIEDNPAWFKDKRKDKDKDKSKDKYEEYEHYYDRIIGSNWTNIKERFYQKNKHWKPPSGWGFTVLRRWNSFTPALAVSDGGGYFLFHANDEGEIDLGVVIDPGYAFVKNFLSEGFGISEITAVLVSHDHPDHLDDFSKIINLLVECKKLDRRTSRTRPVGLEPIRVGLSAGAFKQLKPSIESVAARDVIKDTKILFPPSSACSEKDKKDKDEVQYTIDSNSVTEKAKVEVVPIEALHKGASGTDSIGLRLNLFNGEKERVASIGLPCDTKWCPDIAEKYKDCDVVCLHVGSVLPRDQDFLLTNYFEEDKTRRLVLNEKQHLYLPGTLWFAEELATRRSEAGKPRLLILSEFGEELKGGLRSDLAKKLENFYGLQHDLMASRSCPSGSLRVIAGDVGLTIDPVEGAIRCSHCGQFYSWSFNFSYQVLGPEEQILYVCPTCESVVFADQRSRRYSEKQVGFRLDV